MHIGWKWLSCLSFLQTEIVGLQLATLSDKQRDELALLVAERSVVVSASSLPLRVLRIDWVMKVLPRPRSLSPEAERAWTVPRRRRDRDSPAGSPSPRRRWRDHADLAGRSQRQQDRTSQDQLQPCKGQE